MHILDWLLIPWELQTCPLSTNWPYEKVIVQWNALWCDEESYDKTTSTLEEDVLKNPPGSVLFYTKKPPTTNNEGFQTVSGNSGTNDTESYVWIGHGIGCGGWSEQMRTICTPNIPNGNRHLSKILFTLFLRTCFISRSISGVLEALMGSRRNSLPTTIVLIFCVG